MGAKTKSKSQTPAKGRSIAQAATCTSELKSALWDAANTLRGSAVDRTDWKGYILPLLFFKRISDVWDEETAEAQEMYGEADPSLFPEIHRFVVPEGCHWNDVRDVASNVGTALRRAMQEIERANLDTLFRVFGNADWGDKEKFSDELLKDLIEGFARIGLGNAAASTDVLGDAYEYLVGKFADVTRRNKAGEFYTPRSVVRMMVEILDPQEGESIYDPACGTGGMLLGAIEHIVRERRRRAHLLRQDLRAGEEPHDLRDCSHEPRAPWHRGLPDRPAKTRSGAPPSPIRAPEASVPSTA